MFNLKKRANLLNEKALTNQTLDFKLQNDGLNSEEKMLEEVRDNKDLNVVTEKQMSERQKKESFVVTEKSLNSSSQRNDVVEGRQVKPLDLLNFAHEEERLKAYKEAEKEMKRDTEFWDNFIGEDNVPEKKVISRQGPSQLQNQLDRFEKLDTKVDANPSIKKMVSAALKDIDAKVFHIYAQASQKGNMTEDQTKELISLRNEKIVVLSASYLEDLAHEIARKRSILEKTDISDERHQELQDEIKELSRQYQELQGK